MGYSYTDIPEQELESIKKEFLLRYKSNIEAGDYDQTDLERLGNGTDWVRAFFKHSQENNDKTVTSIHEVLCWRKEFECNSLLTPNKLPFSEDLFVNGEMFMRNEDIHCLPMLHFVTKKHKKDQFPHNQVCKFISYYFEKTYKFNVEDPIVLLFDMSEAGYSNLDMDMIKFVVTCLKTYYPGLIDYMIIYQMPFIFNAAWKIIKNWLPPESVKLIKFVDKKSIREYVHETQLFTHMGGTDAYKYAYDPKIMFAPPQPKPVISPKVKREKNPINNEIKTNSLSKNNDSNNTNKMDASTPIASNSNETQQQIEQTTTTTTSAAKQSNESMNRSSSFASSNHINSFEASEKDQTTDQQVQLKNASSTNTTNKITSSRKPKSSLSNRSFDLVGRNSVLNQDNTLSTSLLKINPGDELVFQITDSKSDICQTIMLTNVTETNLAYKIKITSPDKFRVKPGTGIIEKSSSVQIMINYLKEFHNSTTNNKDKFLILWTPINEKLLPNELNEFWKQTIQQKINLHEHKVKCLIKHINDANLNDVSTSSHTNLSKSLNSSPSSPQFSTPNLNSKSKEVITTSKTTATSSPVNVANDKNYISSKAYKRLIDPSANETISLDFKESLINNDNNNKINFINSNNLNYVQSNEQKIVLAKFNNLEINVNKILNNQQRLSKQFTVLLFLSYFLILLNLIQILFQSNLFSQIVEPYIDYFLFQKRD